MGGWFYYLFSFRVRKAMRKFLATNVVWFILVLANCCVAQTNIALHRPYTLEPDPTYSYCSGPTTGATDPTDLTDGININALHTKPIRCAWAGSAPRQL